MSLRCTGKNASHCKIHDREKSSSYKISLRPPFASLYAMASGLCNTIDGHMREKLTSFTNILYLQYSGHVSAVLPWPVHRTVSLWGVLPRGHALVQLVKVWKFKRRWVIASLRTCLMHSPLASSKEVILWLGENPCSAPIREALPPESAPRGRAPVGVRPLSCKTCSDSSLKCWEWKVKIKLWLDLENTDLRTENTLAIFPIARILFLMTSFLTWAWPDK